MEVVLRENALSMTFIFIKTKQICLTLLRHVRIIGLSLGPAAVLRHAQCFISNQSLFSFKPLFCLNCTGSSTSVVFEKHVVTVEKEVGH